MAILSSTLANGQQSDVTQYNNLRSDLLDEHDHSAGKGGTVSHGNLSDGRITGTYLNHVDLNKHVQGAGTVVGGSDDPGGDRGVHGLPSTAYVMGVLGGQYAMQYGAGTTDGVLEVDGSGYYDRYEDITFPAPFSVAPKVYITPNDANAARVGVTSVTATTFRALVGFPFGTKAEGGVYRAAFSWIAVGTLA